MKNKKINVKNNAGITLITLVITIIVLLILSTVAAYSGIEAIENTKMTTFTAELKIMQTHVNDLYDKWSNGGSVTVDGKTYTGNEATSGIQSLGKDLSEYISEHGTIKEDIEDIFGENRSGFKFYSNDDLLQKLGIEGTKQSFFVNIEKRIVVSELGLKYKNQMYYTLDQLPDGFYNVEYIDEKYKIAPQIGNIDITTFDDYSWRFTVNDIKYGGYINKGKVLYQKDGISNWRETEDDYFIVTEPGKYNIKIVDSAGNESEPKTQYAYVKDGLILFYDGINNTRNGHVGNATVWEDLSGNNNDATLSGFNYNNESGWLDNGLICNGENNKFTTSDVNLPQNSDLSISITFKENRYVAYNGNSIILSSNNGWKSFLFHTWYTDKDTKMLDGSIYIGGNFTDGKEGNRFSPSDMKGYKTTEGKTDNITYVYNGDTKEAKLYINGSKPITKTYTAEPQEITNFRSGTGNYKTYNNILIYNRALTDDEIKINYEMDKERYILSE